jgi:hypothetical protein
VSPHFDDLDTVLEFDASIFGSRFSRFNRREVLAAALTSLNTMRSRSQNLQSQVTTGLWQSRIMFAQPSVRVYLF